MCFVLSGLITFRSGRVDSSMSVETQPNAANVHPKSPYERSKFAVIHLLIGARGPDDGGTKCDRPKLLEISKSSPELVLLDVR